jgi:archaellum component FlaC
MTQAPNQIERLESIIERIDNKLEAIAADQTEIKVSQARTEARVDALEEQVTELRAEQKSQFTELKSDLKSQDNRLWGFVVALFLSLGGILAKVVFFSQIP